MKNISGKTKTQIKLLSRRNILYVALLSAGFFLIAAALNSLVADRREYDSARREYDQLRELYYVALSPQAAQTVSDVSIFSVFYAEQLALEDEVSSPVLEISVPAEEQIAAPPQSLAEINPDFVGWIAIEGTAIDYPVVRGADNEVYLKRSFSKRRSSSGAIFMDYRCEQGFSGPACMIYGHNMRDGAMFAPLVRYLKPAFLEAHPEIFVSTLDGETLIYRIFEVRRTDVWDKAYSLDFSDIAADRLLVLSTCINGSDEDARLLIYCEFLE